MPGPAPVVDFSSVRVERWKKWALTDLEPVRCCSGNLKRRRGLRMFLGLGVEGWG